MGRTAPSRSRRGVMANRSEAASRPVGKGDFLFHPSSDLEKEGAMRAQAPEDAGVQGRASPHMDQFMFIFISSGLMTGTPCSEKHGGEEPFGTSERFRDQVVFLTKASVHSFR